VTVGPTLGVGPVDHQSDRAAQGRQLVLDDRPDQIEINLEVAVHQHLTHTNNLSPRDVRLLATCVLGEAAGSFADDL
jgi:hypothetical protein